ncbi:thioesterase family protein [Staphylococcus chromogenes]|nr:thioesterase family protein [Staphylococcus chromogenes]
MASKEHNRKIEGPMHLTKVPVRWGDFDRFGHINNASFVELAQEARQLFAQEEFVNRGLEMPAVFVRTLTVDYLSPVLPDTTEVIVETQVSHLGRTSFTTVQQVKDRHGNVACIVECVQVAMDLVTAAPRPIREDERKILTAVASANVALESATDNPDTTAE